MIPCLKYEPGLSIKNDILGTLAYFDIFTYPLKKREISLFLRNSYDLDEFEVTLQLLVDTGVVFKVDGFYSLQNNYAIAQRRKRGNEKAAQMMLTAEKVALFLSKFPYVSGVAVSGSLSKNFGDDDSDIDLFIITAQNRLWIARTILHCFKKITFFFNKQHLYCMNYFVDEGHLEIAEKNIYTATEIATLMPLQGSIAFTKFYSANGWTKAFLPNNYMRISSADSIRSNWIRWFAETLLNNLPGNGLDNLLMKITENRWLNKTRKRKLNSRGIVMGMCASKHCAKPDPRNYQHSLLERYDRKVMELLNNNVINMNAAR